MFKRFYLDSCIYLNLWQKEKYFWKKALDFFEKHKDGCFIYSGFILKELDHVLGKKIFDEKRNLFDNDNFLRASLSSCELDQIRTVEKEVGGRVSFYDIIHMFLARKTDSVLVTRDEDLIFVSRRYSVLARKPEEL